MQITNVIRFILSAFSTQLLFNFCFSLTYWFYITFSLKLNNESHRMGPCISRSSIANKNCRKKKYKQWKEKTLKIKNTQIITPYSKQWISSYFSCFRFYVDIVKNNSDNECKEMLVPFEGIFYLKQNSQKIFQLEESIKIFLTDLICAVLHVLKKPLL